MIMQSVKSFSISYQSDLVYLCALEAVADCANVFAFELATSATEVVEYLSLASCTAVCASQDIGSMKVMQIRQVENQQQG